MKTSKYNGYTAVYMPEHHMALNNGMVYYHRLVAENLLGRRLKDDEYVHHINGKKDDNREENLMVFKSNADHVRFHRGGQAVLDGDVYIAKYNYHSCPICGKRINTNAKLCRNCMLDSQRANRPSKEELSNLIQTKPFTHIAKLYGVTDNAIRKWCVSYNLPYRRKDIESFEF